MKLISRSLLAFVFFISQTQFALASGGEIAVLINPAPAPNPMAGHSQQEIETATANSTAAAEQAGAQAVGTHAQYPFPEAEKQIKVCQESATTLFGSSCNQQSNPELVSASAGVSFNAENDFASTSEQSQRLANSSMASLGRANEQCEASMWSCGDKCENKLNAVLKNEKVACDKHVEVSCGKARATYLNANLASATTQEAKLQVTNAAQAKYDGCTASGRKYCSGVVAKFQAVGKSSVTKCTAAKVAFFAVTAAGLVALSKMLNKSKKVQQEVSTTTSHNDSTPTPTPTVSYAPQIVWQDGQHSMVNAPTTGLQQALGSTTVISGNNDSSSSTIGTRGSSTGSSSSTQGKTTSGGAYDYQGYDPAQEYRANGSTQQKAGASASDVNSASGAATTAAASSGSTGSSSYSAGGGQAGGNVAANTNSEMAAYLPGGQHDPASAMRAYNEARAQIGFAHGPALWNTVSGAYDRYESRLNTDPGQ